MVYYTYILFSVSINRFYIGSTHNLEKRLTQHNKGESNFTSRGVPWTLVYSQSFEARGEAIRLENKIKKRGANRFLQDNAPSHHVAL